MTSERGRPARLFPERARVCYRRALRGWEGAKIVMWVIALALSASAQAGPDDLPAPLVRALRARPPSFHCHYEAKPPVNTVILDCTPVCAHPPKMFSVRELMALDASPRKASQLSHVSAQQYEDWHHYCDRKTS